MRVLGFDPGTTRANPAAVALLSNTQDGPTLLGAASLYPAKAESLSAFLGRLGARLRGDWLSGVVLLGVEWPYVGANPRGALVLAACCGVALAAAGERGVRTKLISPQHAKLALAGHGAADKAAMMAAARLRFGRALPKDEADAVGIALAAMTEGKRTKR